LPVEAIALQKALHLRMVSGVRLQRDPALFQARVGFSLPKVKKGSRFSQMGDAAVQTGAYSPECHTGEISMITFFAYLSRLGALKLAGA